MSGLNQFEQLLARARQDVPPAIDVAERVLASVRVVRAKPIPSVDRMALLFAAGAVLAASIVAMVAWQLVEQPMLAEVPNPFVIPVMASQ